MQETNCQINKSPAAGEAILLKMKNFQAERGQNIHPSGALSMPSESSMEAMYEGSGRPSGTSYFLREAAIFLSISAAALAFSLCLYSQKQYIDIARVTALQVSIDTYKMSICSTIDTRKAAFSQGCIWTAMSEMSVLSRKQSSACSLPLTPRSCIS